MWEASYLPFGGVNVASTDAIDLRFPGQWFHAENGPHQNWMRYYDPTTGRYMQSDPLGLVDGASVYGYALQNPGRYVDQRGEQSIRFNGSSVTVFGSNGLPQQSVPAVSGNQNSCQCSEDMYESNFGPFPEGSYTVNPNETNRWGPLKAIGRWGSPVAWGSQRTLIRPNGHDAGGRYEMYMHGGWYPGSAGCVDLTGQNNAFHRWLRRQSGPVPFNVDYPDNNYGTPGPR